MRLKVSRNAAEERLIALITEGHRLRLRMHNDYRNLMQANAFNPASDSPRYRAMMAEWTGKVQGELRAIFPTDLELLCFSSHASHTATSFSGLDQEFGRVYHQDMPLYLERLKGIIDTDLRRYTDLPIEDRLYVEDIDSFSKVRSVNHAMVAHLLTDGYADLPENQVQMALEQILDVPFHKEDWGGEINDLYTANLVVNGNRTAAAFLLKGNGLRKKVMEIRDCGKNGDQHLRLFDSPAELFVIQFVGTVSDALVKDVAGKVQQRRAAGQKAWYLIMDGQDTVKLLHAYGKLA
jgi:hypothetical protein